MNNKGLNILAIVIVILVIGFGGFVGYTYFNKDKDVTPKRTKTVTVIENRPINSKIKINGKIPAFEYYNSALTELNTKIYEDAVNLINKFNNEYSKYKDVYPNSKETSIKYEYTYLYERNTIGLIITTGLIVDNAIVSDKTYNLFYNVGIKSFLNLQEGFNIFERRNKINIDANCLTLDYMEQNACADAYVKLKKY